MLLPFVISNGVFLSRLPISPVRNSIGSNTHCLSLCYSCHIFADILEKHGFMLSDGYSFLLFILRVSLEVVFPFRFDTSLPF